MRSVQQREQSSLRSEPAREAVRCRRRLGALRTWLAACLGSLLIGALSPQLTAAEDASLLSRMLRESPSVDVRARAATALGRRGDVDKRSDLEIALADQHPSVRAAAAWALGRLGSRASLPPLHQVVAKDRDKAVTVEARNAIQTIETRAPSAEGTAPSPAVDPARAHFGLMLGEMRNQSAVKDHALVAALGKAVGRGLKTFADAVVFSPEQLEPVRAARERGLGVYSLDAAVTSLEPSVFDGQLLLHCEVLLLVMDHSTGLLRTLLKGAARGVEVPMGEQAQQVRAMAPRVIEAAVQSALRNSATMLASIVGRSVSKPSATLAPSAAVTPVAAAGTSDKPAPSAPLTASASAVAPAPSSKPAHASLVDSAGAGKVTLPAAQVVSTPAATPVSADTTASKPAPSADPAASTQDSALLISEPAPDEAASMLPPDETQLESIAPP